MSIYESEAMKLPGNIVFIAAALALVLGGLFRWAVRAEVEPAILVAVIAASATVVAAVLGSAVTQYNTKLREIEQSHRLPKSEAYDEFGKLVTDIFANTKIKDEAKRAKFMPQLESQYTKVIREFILWASPTLLERWLQFRNKVTEVYKANSPRKSAELMLELNDVFRAIRADLGLPNKRIARGDLVKVFLADPTDLDKMLKG